VQRAARRQYSPDRLHASWQHGAVRLRTFVDPVAEDVDPARRKRAAAEGHSVRLAAAPVNKVDNQAEVRIAPR
jgi:hypothetical protein